MQDEDISLSGYRRLVDRYVDLTRWTTARKTALVTLLHVPVQLATFALMALAWPALQRVGRLSH